MARADLRQRRRALTTAWESFIARGRSGGSGVRAEVAASWQRSAAALPPTVASAPVDDDVTTREAWDASPVRAAFPIVEDEVRRTADDLDYVGALTDASGRILWTAGGRTMRAKAEQVGFVPGGHWDEGSVGTNALDLALRQGTPATVYSAEHFSPAVHGWVCYAAPVVHPVTGDVLGVLDLSSTWDRAHPMALTSVTALARALVSELGRAIAAGAAVPGPRPPGEAVVAADSGSVLVLDLLGTGRVKAGGTPLLVNGRQREILALLALHPGGLRLEELHAHLYGDAAVATATLKAELSHLRRAIGGGIASRPYRLDRPVVCDVLDVVAALREGDVATAVSRYGGSLMPRSESPTLVAWRHQVDVAVRDAVLSRRDPDLAVSLSDVVPDDLEVIDHAWALLPVDDPRRALLAGRLAALESA